MSTNRSGCSYSTLRRRIRQQTHTDLQAITDRNENLHEHGSLVAHSNTRQFYNVNVVEKVCAAADLAYESTKQMPLSSISHLDDQDIHPVCEEDISDNFGGNHPDNLVVHDRNNSLSGDIPAVYDRFSSECESDFNEVISDKNLCEEIRSWALEFSVTHSAIAGLLKILQPHHKSLPSDPRTLLKTPRFCPVRKLDSGGEYCHIGLNRGLLNLLKGSAIDCGCLQLQFAVFNIDGLPIYKSTSLSVWPIQCLVVNPQMPKLKIHLRTPKGGGGTTPPWIFAFPSEFFENISHGYVFGVKESNRDNEKILSLLHDLENLGQTPFCMTFLISGCKHDTKLILVSILTFSRSRISNMLKKIM